jgi:hypothetical protein
MIPNHTLLYISQILRDSHRDRHGDLIMYVTPTPHCVLNHAHIQAGLCRRWSLLTQLCWMMLSGDSQLTNSSTSHVTVRDCEKNFPRLIVGKKACLQCNRVIGRAVQQAKMHGI